MVEEAYGLSVGIPIAWQPTARTKPVAKGTTGQTCPLAPDHNPNHITRTTDIDTSFYPHVPDSTEYIHILKTVAGQLKIADCLPIQRSVRVSTQIYIIDCFQITYFPKHKGNALA